MIVRAATKLDKYDVVVRMGREFFDSTYYAEFADYSESSVGQLFDMLLESGVLLVAEKDYQLIGVVGMGIVPFTYNHSLSMACEVLWYVSPEAQGQGAGKALLEAVEPACKAAGADLIQMTHLESSPPQAAQAYEKAGYTLKEHYYMKAV